MAAGPGWEDRAAADVTPASRRQDHTTSPSASAPFVSKPFDRSQIPREPALRSRACLTLPRPPHPAPTFVTMANAPPRGRNGAGCKSDLGLRRSRIFLQKGLDTQIKKLPVGQITP